MKKNPIRCSTAEMAHLLGIAPRTLRDFVAKGCPRNARDEFVPADVVAWIRNTGHGKPTETSEIRAALYKSQTELQETKNRETRANLIRKEAADEIFEAVKAISVEKIREAAGRQSNSDIQAEMMEAADSIAAHRPNWTTGTTNEVDSRDD